MAQPLVALRGVDRRIGPARKAGGGPGAHGGAVEPLGLHQHQVGLERLVSQGRIALGLAQLGGQAVGQHRRQRVGQHAVVGLLRAARQPCALEQPEAVAGRHGVGGHAAWVWHAAWQVAQHLVERQPAGR